jgi:hypothetical protein
MAEPVLRPVSRRTFLCGSAAFAVSPALADLGLPAPKTSRVVLVAFAGGVRSKEVIGAPQNVPNLTRIARAGVVMPKVRCENVGHYGAALSIFTGNVEALGIRDNERGASPTLFEYLRKDAGLGAGDVWLSTSGGVQSRLFAHSDNANYGAAYAAQVLDGDGIFNVEFKKLVDSFGKPKEDNAGDRAMLDRLGDALQRGDQKRAADAARQRAVERFILEELSGANAKITGPGASDAKSIRVGTNLLRAFRPKFLGITLQNHDIAHGSFNGYVEVIRRNDAELGKLWDTIQADPELRDTTTVLVLPEFGRDQNLNERNGLDHGDGSDDLHQVFLIGAGPDLKRDKIITKEARTIDVCPTVLSLLGCKAPAFGKARVLKDLLA